MKQSELQLGFHRVKLGIAPRGAAVCVQTAGETMVSALLSLPDLSLLSWLPTTCSPQGGTNFSASPH
jgi:hypothetical protein